jgi:hypothetical protein
MSVFALTLLGRTLQPMAKARSLQKPLERAIARDSQRRLGTVEVGSFTRETAHGPVLVRSFQRKQMLNQPKDMTPFYGKDIGPRGQIANPRAEITRLGLKSGLPGAPTDVGFFNPAVAALLQKGVAPKQTLAYYQKQMGSRGGKLPPGQFDDIARERGWTARSKIQRDDLAKEIDGRAPPITRTRHQNDDAQYKDWSTSVDASSRYAQSKLLNYSEDVIGYPNPTVALPRGTSPADIGLSRKNAVGLYDDNHFQHLNTEGWVRTQDMVTKVPLTRMQQRQAEHATKVNERLSETYMERMRGFDPLRRAVETERANLVKANKDAVFELVKKGKISPLEGERRIYGYMPDTPSVPAMIAAHEHMMATPARLKVPTALTNQKTRVVEEVQPQRYQKMRDTGKAASPDELRVLTTRVDTARTKYEDALFEANEHMVKDAGWRQISRDSIFGSSATISTGLKDASSKNSLAKEHFDKMKTLADSLSHAMSNANAAKKGVAPSPYTHDVNAATDLLARKAMIDSARDGVNRIAWAHGPAQAERYNLANVAGGVRLDPTSGGSLQFYRPLPESFRRTQGNDRAWQVVPHPRANDGVSKWTKGDVEAVLGKDVAKRLTSSPKEPIGNGAPGSAHTMHFNKDEVIGGHGMRAFYGDGKTPGILGDRLASNLRMLGQKKPQIKPTSVGDESYPSYELSRRLRMRIREVGMPMYSSAGAGIALGQNIPNRDKP